MDDQNFLPRQNKIYDATIKKSESLNVLNINLEVDKYSGRSRKKSKHVSMIYETVVSRNRIELAYPMRH